jgi:hypothetical protein
MEGKDKLLSTARKIIIEDEKLKVMLREGKISQITYDDKHGEVNLRLSEIREQMADLERKKNRLSVPASVEKFNNSFFFKRSLGGNKENLIQRGDALSNVGMLAVLSTALILIGLMAFPPEVYSSLPALPEPYKMQESSEFYGYVAALFTQIFAGGFFLWLMARFVKVKNVSQDQARICAPLRPQDTSLHPKDMSLYCSPLPTHRDFWRISMRQSPLRKPAT